MTLTRSKHESSVLHRQVGRKVLQADRLARALDASKRSRTRKSWRPLFLTPKLITVLCIVLIGVSALAYGGTQIFMAHEAVAQKAAAAQRQTALKAKSIAANECRRKKAEQKADQIGKITYDQLYDHTACDQ